MGAGDFFCAITPSFVSETALQRKQNALGNPFAVQKIHATDGRTS
jgi:hypothetical protein